MKLVTGGSGLLGRYLVKELSKTDNVRVLDLNKGTDKAEYIVGSTLDEDILKRSLKDVDYVFHLAALLPQSKVNADEMYRVNVKGSDNVFRLCLENDIKVVFISSSAVYGMPKPVSFKENDTRIPFNDYGRSKLKAEESAQHYFSKGLKITTLRPMTIIGHGIYGIFKKLFIRIRNGQHIFLIGNGENRIQMVAASDLVNACIVASHKKLYGEAFNVGSDNVPTLKQQLEDVIKHAQSKTKVFGINAFAARNIFRILYHFHLSPLTPKHYKMLDKTFLLDISKAQKLLGWEPARTNTDATIDAYDWFIRNNQ